MENAFDFVYVAVSVKESDWVKLKDFENLDVLLNVLDRGNERDEVNSFDFVK